MNIKITNFNLVGRRFFFIFTIQLFIFFEGLMAQTKDFDIQGHRGCRGLLPENTIPAFIRAIDIGVNTLEMDVVISGDRKVVVSHDPFFEPSISTFQDGTPVTEGTKGNLFKMDYKEIKKVDVGERGNPRFKEQAKIKAYKPLLKKVLKKSEKHVFKKGLNPIRYNIELKSLAKQYGISQPEPPEFCNLVYNVLKKYVSLERVTIQSFDFNILKYWNEQIEKGNFEKTAISVLIEPHENNDIEHNLMELGFRPTTWSPYFELISPIKVQKLHQLGIKVIPWTVNEIEDMREIRSFNCDGLITDYPDRAIFLKTNN